MVLPCLDLALERGIGEDLGSVRRNPAFTALLAEEERQFRRRDRKHLERMIAARDPIDVNYFLNTATAGDAFISLKRLPEFQPDFEERALLRYLGRRLCDVAAATLPPACLRLAEKMKRKHSLARRLEICRELLKQLKYRGPSRDMREQMASQKSESVLPLEYGKGADYNCLGLFQRLAGWARRADLRVRVAIPLRSSELVWLYRRACFFQKLVNVLSELPGPANHEAAYSYRRWIESWNDLFSLPSWMHFAVLLELVPGVWVLVDPYSRQLGIYPQDRDLERKMNLLTACGPAFPGLKLIHNCGSALSALDGLVGRYQGAAAEVRKFAELLLSGAADNGRLMFQISEEMLALQEKVDGKPLAKLSGSMCNPEHLIMRKQSALDGLIHRRALNRRNAACTSAEEYPAYFARLADTAMWDEYAALRQSDLVHPTIEIGDAEFTAATATIGHLAYCEGRADAAKQVLVNHCGSQYHLLYFTGSLLEPDNERQRPRLLRARGYLEAYPMKLRNTHRFLKQLQSLST